MESFAPCREASGAAKAVRARNVGTDTPAAISVEARRKSRRDCMGDAPKKRTKESQRTQREDTQRRQNTKSGSEHCESTRTIHFGSLGSLCVLALCPL